MSKYAVLGYDHDDNVLEITTVCDTMEDARNKLVERVERYIDRAIADYGADADWMETWKKRIEKSIRDFKAGNSNAVLDIDICLKAVFFISEVGNEIILP